MKEYKEFKYSFVKNITWNLIYPSGFKTVIKASSEDQVKVIIDDIILNYANK